jgi:hypothetical protein
MPEPQIRTPASIRLLYTHSTNQTGSAGILRALRSAQTWSRAATDCHPEPPRFARGEGSAFPLIPTLAPRALTLPHAQHKLVL